MTISDFPVDWLPAADSIVKATLVLGGAAAATFALRHASAALRHLIWTIALVGALLMPALSVALPAWRVPVFAIAEPGVVREAPSVAPPSLPQRTTGEKASAGEAPALSGTPASVRAADAPSRVFPWTRVLIGLWVVGAALILGRVLLGHLAVQWMAWQSERVLDAPWMKMAVALAAEVGVSPNITFLRSGGATMPMACGVLRPAVMMPAEADAWPADRLRIVLLHELAHVKRRDCLTHFIAQLACALHWFNPLAWVAARNVRTERERACDDLVLAAGTHGPDYADQLLEIARAMRAGRYPGVLAGASLAMAHRSQLEGRLMAILDPRVPHSRLSRFRAAAATVLSCAAIVPVAALQPWDQSPRALPPAPPVVTQPVDVAEPPTTPAAAAPHPSPAPLPNAAVPVLGGPAVREAVGALAEVAAHGAMQGVAESLSSAHEAIDHDLEDREQTQGGEDSKTSGRSAKGDPRMIAALTAALKDSDKEVRETAMHALIQLRDPAIFDPLVQALKDAAPDVREQAAFGLGQLRDKRASGPLTAALEDKNADVREQVVFALGQLRDPAAIEGLSAAMRDASASVREQAAFALGQIRDRRAVEPLVSALKDSDADVREQAAFALGQIRDATAVEPLIIAMKDASASVREQVAFALGQLRDPRAIEALTTALKDAQASVRQQAAFALGQLAR